jgi:hypothetical protein
MGQAVKIMLKVLIIMVVKTGTAEKPVKKRQHDTGMQSVSIFADFLLCLMTASCICTITHE